MTAAGGVAAAPEEAHGERHGWLLAVCCVAQFMVILDLSIVNVALPAIQSSLGFSSIDLQWVVDAYAIAFAGFLMVGGRATDRYGQRRALVLALAGFAAASLVGGLAPTQNVLIAARGFQGLCGALMAAASLAAITSAFPPGPARHRAIGLWAAMNGAGGATGVLLGGVITDTVGWRWVLLINVPVGLAAAAGAAVLLSDDAARGKAAGRIDVAGALTLTGGLVALVYGIVAAGYLGWGAAGAWGPIAAGVALLAAFLALETRTAAPLVPLRALTPQLRRANGVVLLFSAALFPMWFVSSLYLQQVLALSPLEAGLAFLPMALTIMVAARQAGRLVSLFGARSVLTSGLTMMTAGLLLLARIGSSGSAAGYVILPGVLVALGIALSIVPSTIAATQGARPEQAGLASGLVNTSRQVGGAVGIALLISLASQRTSNLIGDNRSVLGAVTDGFRLAYLVGAGLCVAAAACARLLLADTAAPRSRSRLAAAVAVVLAAFVAADFGFAGGAGRPIGAFTTRGTYAFVSAPALHPPKIELDAAAAPAALSPGYVLTANFFDLTNGPIAGQSGPMILDRRLRPVWFRPVPEDVVASNLSVQTYRGEPVLAWWQGVVTSTGQIESGEIVVVDRRYRTVATLHGTGGWIITLHDLAIRGDRIWVTANRNVPMNLTKWGGANNGALVDSAVQAYSLSTGKLLYSWDAFDHIPLSDSHALPPANGFPWDAYHVNSLQLEGDGRLLVSMRDTWAAYQVDLRSGRILWTLGGRHSTFRFGPNADFQWQHDVVARPGGEVTLFDDHCCQATGAGDYLSPEGPSRGLVLRLDLAARTARLVREYRHDGDLHAAYMGSFQQAARGNVVVGWGAEPYISEYTPDGRVLLDGKLPSPDLTYRAVVEPWVGVPHSPPAAAVRGRTVYASWNGSTELASWRVLAGGTVVARRPKTGFETSIRLPRAYRAVRVQALDRAGRVLATAVAQR
ncbi:MAG TPA: MFS transporter [Gaiellaceae bacterium]|nr:MFS transporter [Gaiellaceae bacterium]